MVNMPLTQIIALPWLSYFQHIRLPKPYKTKCRQEKLPGIGTYTKDGCISQCLANMTLTRCGCRTIAMLQGLCGISLKVYIFHRHFTFFSQWYQNKGKKKRNQTNKQTKKQKNKKLHLAWPACRDWTLTLCLIFYTFILFVRIACLYVVTSRSHD